MIRILVLALTLFSTSAFAGNYKIDYSKSKINFSGKHAGKTFNGTFESWQGDIHFDAGKLDTSSVKITFKTSSAKTGNALYDRTLPQLDWFNVKEHKEASFNSTSITKNDNGTYTAKGMLKIRGIEKPFDFSFTLSDPTQKEVNATASFNINRLEYDMGKKSDPGAEWVSKEINITLNIQASAS